MQYNCKLFVLGIVIWSYNCSLRIIISYLKPYNFPAMGWIVSQLFFYKDGFGIKYPIK